MFAGGTEGFDVNSKADIAELIAQTVEDEGNEGNEEENQRRKSVMQRYFSKVEKGSIRSSILGMTTAAIGSGCLTMPNIFKQIGWVNGIVLLCMGAFGCWWSLYMLIQRSRHHNLFNYSQVANKAGGPVLEKVLQVSILTYMYATCLACTIVITQIFV